jgi:hypothetical protein
MNTETLETLVKIFDGIGATTIQIVVAVIGIQLVKFLVGIGAGVYIANKIITLISVAINRMSLTKQLQHDLGYAGDLYKNQREEIVRVWKIGLEHAKD